MVGRLECEVRSRTLAYRSDYRWMLRDIADRMTELVMERFAASSARFVSDDTRDAVTLYQRYTFLKALLEGDAFQAAIAEVLRRPHTAWISEEEWVRPGAGLRGTSQIVRQLSRGGARTVWEDIRIPSLPALMSRQRTEATHDTPPNRFVKFALEHWHQLISDMDRGLAMSAPTPPIARGRREIAQSLQQLDEVLHHELFANTGYLARFPADDQVLHKRAGYRDIFKAYVEFELAAIASVRLRRDLLPPP